MRYADPYARLLFSVSTILLAWNTVALLRSPSVHAEATQYGVEVVKAKLPLTRNHWGSAQYSSELAAGINTVAKGRE